MLKAVFFDLDDTLLPMDEEEFTKAYFGLLCKRFVPFGYDKDLLVKTIWSGTKLMVGNDGRKTNEEVFWDYFASVFGSDKLKDKSFFNDFYTNEFKETKKFCQENKLAKEIIEFCKENVEYVMLTTNPLFPKDGVLTRLGFIGLADEDFDYISSYENSHHSKPNPKYYQEILDKFGLKAEEVIMFGNNVLEDGESPSSIGIKSHMVGNHILHADANRCIFKHIPMEQIKDAIMKEIKDRI